MIVVTVFDRVSSEYSVPYTFINPDDAKRKLYQAYVNNPFHKDLEVYEIGRFEADKGLLTGFLDKTFLYNVCALIAELQEVHNV